MANKCFDFYGAYVRISENQKYKYAEGKLILYYKDLIEELLRVNEQLKSEVDGMFDINKKYEMNEEAVKEAIALEKQKRKQLKHEMAMQKELYEEQI